MRLGIVDLDTSHPAAWLPVERELGAEIVGLWDGGAVHPRGYAENFAREHRIGRVFSSLEEMVPAVDAVVIHGCDWDTHLAKAKPFIEAGKSVLIDKPVAGNLADLRQIGQWAKAGARIFGGSSLRYAPELTKWMALPESERGTPHTALSGCAVDEFNYGIHAYTFACAVMGPGLSKVRWLGGSVQERVQLSWKDGRLAWVVVGEQAGGWMPFYGTIVTDRSFVQMQPKTDDLYRAYLERVWPWLAGDAQQPPCAFEEMIEPELAAIAALQSRQAEGAEVAIGEIAEAVCYDGAGFARRYREQRYS
ncbi:Gfo/Idh/MocA family oxidoreductase [Ruficoccus amylovorans]|uniref:Gfo/Idh/MocA family oxidoreductase n=1 Tax=Ruficoccus amylovorans TaxID=1804625 RepID=A0A842HJR5_9BACT|nr:Gfo/Idh/MocA family oxidoreductase [Ruficoccus amylovorans]MBC2595727.1 Gfo/Idh/MocA family oxidoreductase [Ruficoccus amylovorans]